MGYRLFIALGLACTCAFTACDNTGNTDSSEYVIGGEGKEDSAAAGPLVPDLVDKAQKRIFATITTLPDKTLTTHLVDAAKRNVAIELYFVAKKAGSPGDVLAVLGLEASGVHIMVDRADRCHAVGIVDNQILIVGRNKVTAKTDKEAVEKALAAFNAVLAEPEGQAAAVTPNTLSLIKMPEDTGAEIIGIIAGAKTSINLEIYQLEDSTVTRALVAASQRGVKVRVMLEPKTVGAKNFAAEEAILKEADIDVQPTPPAFDTARKVDHAKFMIVDGAVVLYGSGNLVRSGIGGNLAEEFNTRDLWIVDSRAQTIDEASALFEADWQRQSTAALQFENLVVTPDNANDKVLKLIDSAREKLYVYNQSLNAQDVIDHLVQAKQRGVDVHVLLGLQPSYGNEPPANQPAIDALTQAGITAGFFSRHYLHGKVIVADEQAFIGSQNFTSGGLRNNREVGGIFDDVKLVQELGSLFLADESQPTP